MFSHRSRRASALVAAVALAFLANPFTPAAQAVTPVGTAAADPAPQTVSADALPTVQIDGVVWKQVIAGNTVYAGGEFTSARPAGSAPGTDTVPRSNLLAYNIDTGVLDPSFAPTFNGRISDMAVSPDGSKLVVVGNFSLVNGVKRYRVAVFNLATGALTSAAPSLNASAYAVAVTNSTIYVGGIFSTVGTTARSRVAAANLSNGALLPFTIPIDNYAVRSLAVSPDNGQVLVAGTFSSVGGSSTPGYGLYRADATTGAGLPLPLNTEVRDAGANAGILRLASDGTNFYGGGYHFGSGGNSEGMFQGSWSDGSLVNLEDCHGDTYDIAPVDGVTYIAGHQHYCGNSGGFPQTSPTWTIWNSTAWTKSTQGTNTADVYGYPDHPGTPRPGLLPWFPRWDPGTYTGQNQATWTVTGNSKYVVYGGEFTAVNGTAQQGLVRFTVRSAAPNKQGPRPLVTDSTWTPTIQSYRQGQVKVTWPAMWDRDDKTLTYKVMRDTISNVVYTTQQTNFQWDGLPMSFTDTGLTPGSTTRYYVRATDAWGNNADSGWFDVTVASSDQLSSYGNAVLNDGASKYWPLNEPSGSSTVADYAGNDATTAGSGVTRGAAGAMLNSSDTASSFNGTVSGLVASKQQVSAPNVFTEEVWFKTTSKAGGKIAGFGSSNTGDSGNYDRHVYMDTSGRVLFGVYPGTTRTIQSGTGLNNGQWHQVVASLGSDGMNLYIDGKKVASRSDTTSGQTYQGYWRLGGDNTWTGAKYFNGTIDDFTVYPSVLTARQANNHWVASGRASGLPAAPADTLGKAMYDSQPDSYWRLNESSGQNTAADAGFGTNTGTYSGNVTRSQAGVGGGTAVMLNAASGQTAGGNVTGKVAVVNPTAFSQEVWIKTNTTTGGRIFGFGSSANGTASSNYDRQLWMLDNGQVRFGAYNGNMVTIDSTASLNDNAWHQVVSTFDSSGMRLYVDGKLNSSDPNATAQNYTGYWKLGGDNTWGGNTSMYFTGLVDEAAVYPRALNLSEIQAHYGAGGGTVVNAPPKAAYTSTSAGLTASFDGSGSSDTDGTVSSYSWNFGDNTAAGSGATPSHVYAAGGTFTVTLTVTDDKGATDSVSHDVTVAPPNVKPKAVFTSAATDLTASFDATGSSDSDGTVASYSWNFGDGSAAGSGAKPSHAYASGGTFTVTLTVTDDKGATDSVSHDVSVTSPASPVLASDDFNRTQTASWGTADVGGNWKVTGGSSLFNVAGGSGTMSVPIGSNPHADLTSVSSAAARVTAEFSVDKLVESNYVALVGRQIGTEYYAARLRLAADGSGRVYLLHNGALIGGTNSSSTFVPNLTFVPGQSYTLAIEVKGTSPTSISAKLWRTSDPEPAAWDKSITDASATLQGPGQVGLFGYLPTSATSPVTISFNKVTVTKAQ